MSGVNTIAVLGTGVLGSQIIMQAAYNGKSVHVYDIDHKILDKLTSRWEWIQGRYKQDLPNYTDAKFDEAVSRITTTTDLHSAVTGVEAVIEVVPEDLELKKKVWSQVGAAVGDDTLLLTNTSSLRPSDFAKETGHPKHFLALHFANFIWKFNTGEIMGTPSTEKAYFDKTIAFAKEIAILPVPIRQEIPGYLLNSLLMPWLDAAADLYVKKAANPADVDLDWKNSTGAPNGPFEVFDVIGFNVAVNISKQHPSGSPVRRFANLLEENGIKKGHAGLADGIGFYIYDEASKPIGPNPEWVLYKD